MHEHKNLLARIALHTEEFFRSHSMGLLTRARSRWWRHVFASCAPDFICFGKILVRRPYNVSVGRDVVFSEGVYINARAPVSVGDHVRLSAYVKINTGGHDLEVPLERRLESHAMAPVRIGNWVWLATGALVNPGVTIGDGVVVGAGAVVTRDLPPNTLCLGIPAKPVRDLPPRGGHSA